MKEVCQEYKSTLHLTCVILIEKTATGNGYYIYKEEKKGVTVSRRERISQQYGL